MDLLFKCFKVNLSVKFHEHSEILVPSQYIIWYIYIVNGTYWDIISTQIVFLLQEWRYYKSPNISRGRTNNRKLICIRNQPHCKKIAPRNWLQQLGLALCTTKEFHYLWDRPDGLSIQTEEVRKTTCMIWNRDYWMEGCVCTKNQHPSESFGRLRGLKPPA